VAAAKQHPHVLKHALASHLVAANMNLALVKQQLGHKSISSTMRYITTSDGYVRRNENRPQDVA
jgi:site-specific recombinase XerD